MRNVTHDDGRIAAYACGTMVIRRSRIHKTSARPTVPAIPRTTDTTLFVRWQSWGEGLRSAQERTVGCQVGTLQVVLYAWVTSTRMKISNDVGALLAQVKQTATMRERQRFPIAEHRFPFKLTMGSCVPTN